METIAKILNDLDQAVDVDDDDQSDGHRNDGISAISAQFARRMCLDDLNATVSYVISLYQVIPGSQYIDVRFGVSFSLLRECLRHISR